MWRRLPLPRTQPGSSSPQHLAAMRAPGYTAGLSLVPRRYEVLLGMVVVAGVITTANAWGAAHSLINQAVLPMLPDGLQQRLGSTNTVWPPGDGTGSNVSAFVRGSWAESGDTVAGPCAANLSTPCAPGTVRAKMELRKYCCESSLRARQPL